MLTVVVALGVALYTQHAWEDYWITYRASKNLAMGHGLVFNVGDRLHTFTSPLGVLLPAVASMLTANSSDAAALWIFRVMCIAALGGAAAWLVLMARQLNYGRVAAFFLVAWLVTTALYLPWLVFAHFYYGTVVPHTVAAKSGLGGAHTLVGFVAATLQPFLELSPDGITQARAFLPAYFMIGGWPPVLLRLAWLAGMLCSLLWLVPRLRVETRVASFAFFGAHAYLSYFPYYAFPWYLPSTTLLAFVALGGLVQQASGHPWTRRVAIGAAACILCVSGWTTWQVARELAAQQRIVEDGNRRTIGEWLRANATPGQTVFLEPLGYIGFYSGLKTYDFPGMSSREMVAARRLVGNDWDALIRYLHPDWLVLRPAEITRLSARDSTLLRSDYAVARGFSVAEAVGKLRVYGRLSLMSDARFTVFRATRR